MTGTETIEHIHRDAAGRAWIDDTNIKVIEVVLDQMAYGWSPEEICLQHPTLSLAQVHAALGFYYDNQAAFDAEIDRDFKHIQKLTAQSTDTPLRRRLRASGKLS